MTPSRQKMLRDAAWALDKLTDLCRDLLEPAAAMEPMNAATVDVTVHLTRDGKPMSSTDAQKILDWLGGDEMQRDLRAWADELDGRGDARCAVCGHEAHRDKPCTCSCPYYSPVKP